MDKKVPLFNPLNYDFECTFRRDSDNVPETYKMRAREITYFPPRIATHMKKHLSDAVLNERGIELNAELDRSNIYKEIEVENE